MATGSAWTEPATRRAPTPPWQNTPSHTPVHGPPPRPFSPFQMGNPSPQPSAGSTFAGPSNWQASEPGPSTPTACGLAQPHRQPGTALLITSSGGSGGGGAMHTSDTSGPSGLLPVPAHFPLLPLPVPAHSPNQLLNLVSCQRTPPISFSVRFLNSVSCQRTPPISFSIRFRFAMCQRTPSTSSSLGLSDHASHTTLIVYVATTLIVYVAFLSLYTLGRFSVGFFPPTLGGFFPWGTESRRVPEF